MADTRNFVQGQDYYLAGSGVGLSDTSIILTSLTLPNSEELITMSMFGTLGYMTIEPETSREENISFTGITQNANGTATLTGVTRGLGFVPPYTQDTSLRQSHAGSTLIRITNSAPFYNELAVKGNDETITGYWEGPDPIASQGYVTRDYMLNLINGGTISVNQVIEAGIAGEVIVAGNLLYFSETDNEWLKTDADTISTIFNVKLGIAMGSGTNGNPISGGVLTRGSYTTSGLTQGDLCYASNTAGGINSGTAGTVPRVIGIANSSTSLYFDPDFQNRLYDYVVSTTGNDTYVATMPGALSVPFIGMEVNLKVDVANTGACSFNGISLKKNVSEDLVTGDILANQLIKIVYDGTNYQLISGNLNVFGDFGDGSDGDVTVSGTTTLTRDMYYNNLVVTGTLNTENWRVFVKGTLSGNGTIQCNGGNGGNGGTPTAGAAGAKVPDGYFSTLPGIIGGIGKTGGSNNGTNATAGTAVSTSIGVVGVAGGNGDGVTGSSGGTGGAAGSLTAVLQKLWINTWQTISAIDFALNGTPTKYNGDSGSGGGGGGAERNNGNTHTSGGGGGSGAPGGIMALFVNNWTGTVTLKSTGGNGGNGGDGVRTGSDEAGGGGGGAGGSGGKIYVVYKTKTWTGSYVLTGGTGGTKGTGVGSISAGSNGASGTTGTSTEINIATLL